MRHIINIKQPDFNKRVMLSFLKTYFQTRYKDTFHKNIY